MQFFHDKFCDVRFSSQAFLVLVYESLRKEMISHYAFSDDYKRGVNRWSQPVPKSPVNPNTQEWVIAMCDLGMCANNNRGAKQLV